MRGREGVNDKGETERRGNRWRERKQRDSFEGTKTGREKGGRKQREWKGKGRNLITSNHQR